MKQEIYFQQKRNPSFVQMTFLLKWSVYYTRIRSTMCWESTKVKSDTHMERIRTKLLDEAAGIEKSEQAKKLRLAKKFGKSVQVAKIQERQKEKKALNDKVKEFRKSQSYSYSVTGYVLIGLI